MTIKRLTEIQISGLSKRFRGEWLFKSLDHTFLPGNKIAILGPNGSGKSTFIKIVSGYMGPTEGMVSWRNKEEIDSEHWHRYYGYCAPYQELIEEFSLKESIDFHFSLKSIRANVDLESWLSQTNLSNHMDKLVSRFSSGMKQRLKLVLTLATQSDVYFLDEPCSNLDEEGVRWYEDHISSLPKESIILIASNSPKEYEICTDHIQISYH
jgi:ABC-type multidrug transport system ATPase subunit